jgi:hypothetical protein
MLAGAMEAARSDSTIRQVFIFMHKKLFLGEPGPVTRKTRLTSPKCGSVTEPPIITALMDGAGPPGGGREAGVFVCRRRGRYR